MKLAVEHRTECTKPDLIEFNGRQGDRVEQCRTCGRLRVLAYPGVRNRTPDQVATLATSPAPEPEPVAASILSRFVCQEHLARVNWRGKGCQRCTRELAERRKARRRVARREPAED